MSAKPKRSKPAQGVLFDEPPPNKWNVVTVEVRGVEEHRLRYGKAIQERAREHHALDRFRQLADAHNALGLPPRPKVACAADIGGNLDSALKAQTRSEARLQAADRKAERAWHDHFTHLLVTTARHLDISHSTAESQRALGKTPLEAIAHFLSL